MGSVRYTRPHLTFTLRETRNASCVMQRTPNSAQRTSYSRNLRYFPSYIARHPHHNAATHAVRMSLIVYTESLSSADPFPRLPGRQRRTQTQDISMATVTFAPAIQRHVPVDEQHVDGASVHDVLAQCLTRTPELRGYLFNDQGRLRPHVAVFVDGRLIRDRRTLRDALNDASSVYVAQALSGG